MWSIFIWCLFATALFEFATQRVDCKATLLVTHQFNPNYFSPNTNSLLPNETFTYMDFEISSDDSSGFLQDVNGVEFSAQFVSKQDVSNRTAAINWNNPIDLWGKIVIADLPTHATVIASSLRRDMGPQWAVASGALSTSSNVQNIAQVFNSANVSAPVSGGSARRLLAIQGGNPSVTPSSREMRAAMERKFLAGHQHKTPTTPLRPHPAWQKVVNEQKKELTDALDKLGSLMFTPHTRSLLQTVPLDSGANVGLTPASYADVDAFQSYLTNMLNGTDITGQGAIINAGVTELQNGAAVFQNSNNVVQLDTRVLDQIGNYTFGSDLIAFGVNQNASLAAQMAAIAAVLNTTQIANSTNAWILRTATAALNNIGSLLVSLGTQNSLYNLTAQQFAITAQVMSDFAITIQADFLSHQAANTFANILNGQFNDDYTEAKLLNAERLKFHQVLDNMDTYGLVPFISTLYPAQAGLGTIPINPDNVGFLLQETVFYTFVTSQNAIPFYSDYDMQRVPNYQTSVAYKTAIGGSGNQPVYIANMKRHTVFISSEFLYSLKNNVFGSYDGFTMFGPSGCSPTLNTCNAYMVVNRQRCTAGGRMTSPPPPLNNLYDTGGTICISSNPQQESETWFATSPAALTGSITKYLTTETLTSALDVANEIQNPCNMSLSHIPQTTSTPQGPFDNFTLYYSSHYNSQPVSSIVFAQSVVNNISYCSVDPNVANEQSGLAYTTLPYSFIFNLRLALQSILSQNHASWTQYLYGSRSAEIAQETTRFHTPQNPAPTDAGVQNIFTTYMGATQASAVPCYIINNLGTSQTFTVTITSSDGTSTQFTIPDGNVVDTTSFQDQFVPRTFFWCGYLDCIRNPCPSPNRGYVPDNVRYVYDFPSDGETLSFHNSSYVRMYHPDYMADLRPSKQDNTVFRCVYGPYTLAPNDPLCNYNTDEYDAATPIPVQGADAWNDWEGTVFDPRSIGGSPAEYVRLIELDPINGSPTCVSSTKVLDGTPCDLLKKHNVYSVYESTYPGLIDPFPVFFSEHKIWSKEVSLVFPASSIGVLTDLISTCPDPSQMFFVPVSKAWVTLNIANGYNMTLDLTITFSSPDNAVCNTVMMVSLPPFNGSSSPYVYPVPSSCNNITLLVQSYNPQMMGEQTCWQYNGLMTNIFNASYLTFGAQVADPNSTSSVVASGIPASILAPVDQQYQTNTYTLAISMQNAISQVLSAMTNVVNFAAQLPPGSRVNGSLALSISDYSYVAQQQQNILIYAESAKNTLALTSATSITQNQQESDILSNVYQQTQFVAEAQLNETATLDQANALITQIRPVLQSELANQTEIQAEISAGLDMLDAILVPLQAIAASPFLNYIPPNISCDPSDGCGVDHNWAQISHSYYSIFDLFDGVYQLVKDAVDLIVDQFNPSCPFGLQIGCDIGSILTTLITIVAILLGVCCVGAILYEYCNSGRPSSPMVSKIKERIPMMGSTPARSKGKGDDEKDEDDASSGDPPISIPVFTPEMVSFDDVSSKKRSSSKQKRKKAAVPSATEMTSINPFESQKAKTDIQLSSVSSAKK